MNWEFFAFMVFMSLVSFAVAFLAYGMVIRFVGKDGTMSRISQIILIPACIIFYDFITIATPSQYRYVVGCLPLIAIGGILLYYRFIKGENFAEDKPAPSDIAKLTREEKKFSKKSQRIHAARKNRGRE